MKTNPDQTNIFNMKAVGALKPASPTNDPFRHQKSRSGASSAIALEFYTESGKRKAHKELIKECLFKNQGDKGLTLIEISAITKIIQHGTITGRFEDLRKDNYNLLNDCGRWTIKKRIDLEKNKNIKMEEIINNLKSITVGNGIYGGGLSIRVKDIKPLRNRKPRG